MCLKNEFKILGSSLIQCILSYFEPDRWPSCHAGIFVPVIRRMGYCNVFSILYPHSECYFYLKFSKFSSKISFIPCILCLLCQVFHTFHLLHKCCKLNKNLPWEDRDSSESQTEPVLGLKLMLIPIIAGILSALRRVIARRVSIKVVHTLCLVHGALSVSITKNIFFPFRINLKGGSMP